MSLLIKLFTEEIALATPTEVGYPRGLAQVLMKNGYVVNIRDDGWLTVPSLNIAILPGEQGGWQLVSLSTGEQTRSYIKDITALVRLLRNPNDEVQDIIG